MLMFALLSLFTLIWDSGRRLFFTCCQSGQIRRLKSSRQKTFFLKRVGLFFILQGRTGYRFFGRNQVLL